MVYSIILLNALKSLPFLEFFSISFLLLAKLYPPQILSSSFLSLRFVITFIIVWQLPIKIWNMSSMMRLYATAHQFTYNNDTASIYQGVLKVSFPILFLENYKWWHCQILRGNSTTFKECIAGHRIVIRLLVCCQ